MKTSMFSEESGHERSSPMWTSFNCMQWLQDGLFLKDDDGLKAPH